MFILRLYWFCCFLCVVVLFLDLCRMFCFWFLVLFMGCAFCVCLGFLFVDVFWLSPPPYVFTHSVFDYFFCSFCLFVLKNAHHISFFVWLCVPTIFISCVLLLRFLFLVFLGVFLCYVWFFVCAFFVFVRFCVGFCLFGLCCVVVFLSVRVYSFGVLSFFGLFVCWFVCVSFSFYVCVCFFFCCFVVVVLLFPVCCL